MIRCSLRSADSSLSNISHLSTHSRPPPKPRHPPRQHSHSPQTLPRPPDSTLTPQHRLPITGRFNPLHCSAGRPLHPHPRLPRRPFLAHSPDARSSRPAESATRSLEFRRYPLGSRPSSLKLRRRPFRAHQWRDVHSSHGCAGENLEREKAATGERTDADRD